VRAQGANGGQVGSITITAAQPRADLRCSYDVLSDWWKKASIGNLWDFWYSITAAQGTIVGLVVGGGGQEIETSGPGLLPLSTSALATGP
jgi:hypothetical protein